MAWFPWAVATIAVVGAAVVWTTRPAPATGEARWASFSRITETAGEETSPTLSPDGSTVAYAMRTNGNWDIYSQRVGGRKATPIVNDPRRHTVTGTPTVVDVRLPGPSAGDMFAISPDNRTI